MCYGNFMCFVYRIPYHFSPSINDYSSILYFHYILQITSYVYDSYFIYQYRFIYFNMFPLSLFTCFLLAYAKEVDTGKSCMYTRVLSLYETMISICALLYDPNRATVMTQTGSMSSTPTGPTICVCCNNCIPNRHVHLSIYPVKSRQSVLLRFQYISHIHE